MKPGCKFIKDGYLYSTSRIVSDRVVRILVKKNGKPSHCIRFIKSSGKILTPKQL